MKDGFGFAIKIVSACLNYKYGNVISLYIFKNSPLFAMYFRASNSVSKWFKEYPVLNVVASVGENFMGSVILIKWDY